MVYFSGFFFGETRYSVTLHILSLNRENTNVTYMLDMRLVLLLNAHQSKQVWAWVDYFGWRVFFTLV